MARIDLRMGDIASIVGPTGSGKTTLINDLELLTDGDTPTGRRILVDGASPTAAHRDGPASNPIALITQHTTFLSDMPVREFLATHARVRGGGRSEERALVDETLVFANQLTGEPVPAAGRMTELSGGQARALLIADAAVICRTPVVLLDEVENAGIDRARALELLRRYRKTFVFVTHDPHIALLSDYRLVMREGAVTNLIHTSEEERRLSGRVSRLDESLALLRQRIRLGESLSLRDLTWEERP